MRSQMYALAMVLAASTAQADPVGFSWDSGGPCSAFTIASGVPCHLNAAAIGTAATSSAPFTSIDLSDRTLTEGFGSVLGGHYRFDFLVEITSRFDRNEFGWFDVNTATTGVIFGSLQTMGASVETFIPFGSQFYYRDTLTGQTFEQFGNARQFSLWHTDGGPSYVGIEDLRAIAPTLTWCATCSDYDHNDLVVKAQSVPEPTTLLLFGLGALGASWRLRRQR